MDLPFVDGLCVYRQAHSEVPALWPDLQIGRSQSSQYSDSPSPCSTLLRTMLRLRPCRRQRTRKRNGGDKSAGRFPPHQHCEVRSAGRPASRPALATTASGLAAMSAMNSSIDSTR